LCFANSTLEEAGDEKVRYKRNKVNEMGRGITIRRTNGTKWKKYRREEEKSMREIMGKYGEK
jgi:hypothetical protein